MHSTLDHPALSRRLPSVWEVLRAASGLVAVTALLVIVGGIALLDDAQTVRPLRPAIAAGNVEPVAGSPAGASAAAPPPREAFVLYVVETLEQVQIAEWGESATRRGAYGGYRIVATDAALQAAVQAFVQDALQRGEPLLLEVADLR